MLQRNRARFLEHGKIGHGQTSLESKHGTRSVKVWDLGLPHLYHMCIGIYKNVIILMNLPDASTATGCKSVIVIHRSSLISEIMAKSRDLVSNTSALCRAEPSVSTILF